MKLARPPKNGVVGEDLAVAEAVADKAAEIVTVDAAIKHVDT